MNKLLLIFPLLLMLSPISHGEEEGTLIDKMMINAYRGMAFNEDGDDLLKIFTDLEYFYCEGKGSSKFFSKEIGEEEIINNRTEFIFAFQDVNKDKEKIGLFAISEPSELGEGWLVASTKFLSDKTWKNVWDSKFTFEDSSHPLEDGIKGTVNEFILRVDINRKFEDENWQEISEGMQSTTVSVDWYITMNRKNKNFYWLSQVEKKGKVQNVAFNMSEKDEYEGECTTFER